MGQKAFRLLFQILTAVVFFTAVFLREDRLRCL